MTLTMTLILTSLWEGFSWASLSGALMLSVIYVAIRIGRYLRLRRRPHREDAFTSETSDGVPLGLSVDYDRLPMLELERVVQCMTCDGLHVDAERRAPFGGRVLAVMCRQCRDRGRARWIADHGVDLPQAVARQR